MDNTSTTKFLRSEEDEEEVIGMPVSIYSDERGDVESGEKILKPAKSINHWTNVLYLGFTSLGAIYGDIGTSPLYTFTTIFNSKPPSHEDVYGAMSCIFWVFTLVVIFKYCLVVLFFGPNNGEGGQVAIYAKIARTLKIGPTGVKLPGDENELDDMLLITRSETHDSSINSKLNKKGRFNETFINFFLSKFIMGLCFFGCGLVMSDGLLTPTTSVLSAVSGIAVAVPSFTDKVLPVSCVILVLLFAIQHFGSAKVSILFAPVIFIWLIILLVSGIVNITHHPAIFKSLNPKEAIDYLKRQKDIDVLGSVMLAITGTELMFADIGHFSRLSIQLTLGTFVYPCLMIAYLGQCSYLIDHPDAVSNIFFLSIPGGTGSGFYWFVFVFSTLASIIASQALILGVFSILRQMIHIDCFPKFKIIHMSSKHFGQIYLPTINFLLMILVVCTCVGFKNSNNVTAAYGLGVAMDFFVTTNLITLCLLYVYNVPMVVALLFYLVFGAIDLCLVIAGLKKVPHGAWFPLMMTVITFSFICLWRWGRSLKINQEYNDRVKLRDIFETKAPTALTVQIGAGNNNNNNITQEDLTSMKTSSSSLVARLPGGENVKVTRYEGAAIMYTNVMHTLNSPNTVPALFKHIITSFPAIPKNFIFLGVRVATTPYVSAADRILVEPIRTMPGFHRCVVRFGFMDRVSLSNSIIAEIMARIKLNEIDEEGIEVASVRDGYLFEDGRLNLNVLHIFEKEVVTAEDFKYKLAELNNRFSYMLIKSGIYIRSMFIEQCFSPVNSLFQGVEKIIDGTTNGQEVLYVGNKVKL